MSRHPSFKPRNADEMPLKAQPLFRGGTAARIRELMADTGQSQGQIVYTLVLEALEARAMKKAS